MGDRQINGHPRDGQEPRKFRGSPLVLHLNDRGGRAVPVVHEQNLLASLTDHSTFLPEEGAAGSGERRPGLSPCERRENQTEMTPELGQHGTRMPEHRDRRKKRTTE